MGTQLWTLSDLHLEVVIGLALLLCAYAVMVLRTQPRRGGTVSPLRVASFTSGLFVILIALNGPLHGLADHYLFSAHMIQHLLLTLVAPPLLLGGLQRSPMKSVPLPDGLFRWLTTPLSAFALYNAALIIWHVPLLYDWAMENHAIHIGQHLLFVGTALLLWWPVVGPRESELAPPAQLLYLFVAGIPMILIAAFVTLADEPLYHFYALAPRAFGITPLADQRVGGVIMWVPGSLIYLVAMTVVYFRWATHADREHAEG